MSERTSTGHSAGERTRSKPSVEPAVSVPVALALDAVSMLVFSAVGRASHAEASPLLGALATAWPFLVGALAGWTVAALLAAGGRWPLAVGVRSGLPVWASTVVLGMLLRALSGRGTAVSFVVVAAVVLGAFLLGWRALAAAAQLRARR